MPKNGKAKVLSNFQKGDKVIISQCPKYSYACGSHKAKIIGNPVHSTDGEWVAPIKFYCTGSPAYSNYPCKYMLEREGFKVKLSRPAIVTLVVLAVLGFFILLAAGNYNDLVRARNQVSNTRAQVDSEYTRRYDLIDNIVQSVQGSQAQESDVFGKIAEARKIGGSGNASAETEEQANQAIDTQIALLPRLQEAYPELRSNDQVSKLIAELQGTNNTIRDKKNEYNTTVTNYNTNITAFPKNIFAGIFDFDKEKLMTATTNERVNPKVELDRERN